MKNIHTLLIPDIHGRIFWKEALEYYSKEKYPNLTIVFLGDYVDPYEFEGVSRQDAIDNFQEIINVTKNDSRIHLLIGNHDMHYWYDASYKSRCDFKNYEKIKKMFLDNFDMFNIAYEEIINGEKFLYTHAGVSAFWLSHLQFIGKITVENNKKIRIDQFGNKVKQISDEQLPFAQMLETMTPDADKLNKMKSNFQGQANLWMASWARGGEYQNGSCIWEDWSEWQYENMEISGFWQIFGHSRWSKKDPDDASIDKKRKLACIDTASAWILTNKGILHKFKHKKERFKKDCN